MKMGKENNAIIEFLFVTLRSIPSVNQTVTFVCVQIRELHSLGFRDVSQCEEALRQSGGEVKGALSLLQRPLLEPFHQRIWAEQPEPPIDPKHPDKQVRLHDKTPESW